MFGSSVGLAGNDMVMCGELVSLALSFSFVSK